LRVVVAAVSAIASGVVAGAWMGVLVAATSYGAGVRPRRWLRENARLSRRFCGCGVAVAGAVLVGDVLRTSHDRVALALTCVAVTLLLALATWLLLVEQDDDGSIGTPDEPEWWPAFERELEAWTRRPRVPTQR
jgi:hypothetical protein